MNKILSYIGFAKKSGHIVFGQDNIIKTKNVQIILCDEALSQNTIKKMVTKKASIYILPTSNMQELSQSAKVLAITDKSLSQAIQNQIEEFGGKKFE